jgi:hypothetical protein
MARDRPALLAFNRGEVAKRALARVDVERMRLSAEIQENWLPEVLGPMMLRPGKQYVGGVNGDLAFRLVPFVFAFSDTALIEITDSVLRVWNVDGDDETLVTRAAVGTAVVHGDFGSDTGWTLTATGTGAVATISGGLLTLASPASGGLAQAKRTVIVASAYQAVEHAFRIVVMRGPVTFRAGTSDGDDDLIAETTLDTGTHSLAFTPNAATVYIELETISAQSKIVDSIAIEAEGAMTVPTSWAEADLRYVRFDQSGDIVYCACYGQQQRKIERRGTASWSFVLYKSDDGPFQVANTSDITLTPSVLTGNGTLTASRNLFRSGHVGALFRLFSTGQTVTASLAAQNTFSSAIRVSGVDAARVFNYAITGTWAGTLTLQRSFDSESSGFADVTPFTANASSTYDDSLANSIAWYRIGFKTGAYTSGTAGITLSYVGGGGAGVARVTGFTSRTAVDIEVLSAFSSLTATDNWNQAEWSDVAGWPSAVRFHDGRLDWFGRDRMWGSVSDAFSSFDLDVEGDSAPISRSVGFGPLDIVHWALSLTRLVIGREGQETSVRSGALEEPLTRTNISFKDCSTHGSAPVAAVKVDTRGVFVDKSNRRAYELSFSVDQQDYAANDLTRLNPDILVPGVADLLAQRQPDTQLPFVLDNGEVAYLLYDKQDDVEGWWRLKTAASAGAAGVVECGAVLPGNLEDKVYYGVKRVINGATKRFIEKMARRDQCAGQPEARLSDSHVMYSGAATTMIGGLSHLEGETVTVWGWNTATPFTATLPDGTVVTVGRDLGTFTVASGQITGLASAVTDACVGLGYSARFKSAKLAYAALAGSALTVKKKIDKIGLIMIDTHKAGLQYGQSFDTMDELPEVEEGATVEDDTVWPDFDAPSTALPGEWDSDARLCLTAASPRPCTVAAAVISVTTNE